MIIDGGYYIGYFAYKVAIKEVLIEKEVLLADKAFISDCNNNYQNIEPTIQRQCVSFIKPIIIGEGSWSGKNVCLCGASIGKRCAIGANSVLTRHIPDYRFTVGSLAKAIKSTIFTNKNGSLYNYKC